ncbi:MAG: hypothetical protein V1492_05550 [Candidatus Micrarchaeota archaeon]
MRLLRFKPIESETKATGWQKFKSAAKWGCAGAAGAATVAFAMLIASPVISFDLQQAYHTHNYKADGIGTVKLDAIRKELLKYELESKGVKPFTEALINEIEKPRIYLYGTKAPDKVHLEVIVAENKVNLTYWCFWGNQKGEQKNDWEPVTLTYDSSTLTLDRISYRAHGAVAYYTKEECAKMNEQFHESIPITLAANVHTPGIPSCHPQIVGWDADVKNNFFNLSAGATEYPRVGTGGAAIKRAAGAWFGWPGATKPLDIIISDGGIPAEAKKDSWQ